MTHPPADLQGSRILILEDDYYLATDLQMALEACGALVVGPFADAADAMLVIGQEKPDCAFVDVNLGLGPSFELPRLLVRENVPFAFVTGYDATTIPSEFEGVERIEKPTEQRMVTDLAVRLLG
jgi:two-component SAPR family response regulator